MFAKMSAEKVSMTTCMAFEKKNQEQGQKQNSEVCKVESEKESTDDFHVI